MTLSFTVRSATKFMRMNFCEICDNWLWLQRLPSVFRKIATASGSRINYHTHIIVRLNGYLERKNLYSFFPSSGNLTEQNRGNFGERQRWKAFGRARNATRSGLIFDNPPSRSRQLADLPLACGPRGGKRDEGPYYITTISPDTPRLPAGPSFL